MRLRLSMVSTLLAISSLIGAGTWIFHTIEDWSWAESFYFSVATLTTVGYGDIHPTTDASRIITATYILIGVGIMFAALTSLGSRYLASQEHRINNNITRRAHRHQKTTKTRKRR